MIDLFWLILIPITVATAAMLLPYKTARAVMLLLQVFMVIISFISFLYVKTNGTVVSNIGGWPDYVGIALRADLIAMVMVLVTTVLFLFMVLFNIIREYVNNLFLFLFTVMEGLMIGIFLSNDLFNIFVLVEVSTVIISILIMFKKDSRSIYDGMLYLLINIVSMTFFLFGIGILYKTLGVIDFNGIKEAIPKLKHIHSLILPYSLIITSVSLKSALMPLFSWLPKAHGTPSAPSVVSAILSGLYVKSGLYLFIRIQAVFSPQIDTSELFLVLGFVTAVIGFMLAIAQKDLKLILAYHTVSQIGLIMMGINMNNPQTYFGGIYHIINHAVFKSTLFLTAGMIIDEYRSRDVYKINGVLKRMPLVSVATILAILGITGAPFFNGSISKYWIAYGAAGTWAEYGLVLVNLGTVISFVKYSGIFLGRSASHKSRTQPIRNIIVLAMGIMCLLGGILGEWMIDYLFNTRLIVDPASYFMKTLAFIATLAAGILIYHGWLKKSRILKNAKRFEFSFNSICLAITVFFTFILVYLRVTL